MTLPPAPYVADTVTRGPNVVPIAVASTSPGEE